jgi:hypothetical protein
MRGGLRFGPPIIDFGHTVCLEDGTFRIGGLPDGPYHVIVWWRGAMVTESGVFPDNGDLAFHLPPDEGVPMTGTVEVEVTNAVTSKPVLWVDAIRLLDSDGDERYPQPVAPGRYRFLRVPTGTWVLEVFGEGCATVTRPGIEVLAGDEIPVIKVQLIRGATVRGTVESDSGQPIGSSTIGFHADAAVHSGLIAKDGSFEVVGLTPGERYSIQVASESCLWIPQERSEFMAPEDGSESVLDLVLARRHKMLIKVYPFLRVSDDPEDTRRVRAVRIEVRNSDDMVVWENSQPERGSHTVLLPPGKYTVHAEFDFAPSAKENVTLGERPTKSVRFLYPKR